MSENIKKEVPEVKLGEKIFGTGHPTVIIAEGCDNHMGSLEKAKEMAAAAKESGADIIKWQMHILDEEMCKKEIEETSGEMLKKWGSLWGFYEKFALSIEAHKELKEYCDKIGIMYWCTPFSLKAAQILNEMGVSGFKIGSGETEDLPMIEEIAKMGKPMVISTGMTTIPEIDLTVNAVKAGGAPLVLAHCMSIYAGHPIDKLQLGVISVLRERYNLPVGLSDHTPPEGVKLADGNFVTQEAVIWAALAQGACFVEKHFTLDRKQDDADSVFSLDPKSLRELVSIVRAGEAALGRERRVFEEEAPVALWAKRSLVAATDIKAGTPIARDMITSKRPGTGIRSKDYHSVLGARAVRDIPKGTLMKWEDVQK